MGDSKYFQQWLTFFGIIEKTIESERKRYVQYKIEYFDMSVLSEMDPLNLDENNPWHAHASNEHLESEIEKDLKRLYPSGRVHFFHNDTYMPILRRVLFIWCKLHPSLSYRQGMHDLVSVLLYTQLQQYGFHQFMTEFGAIDHIYEITHDGVIHCSLGNNTIRGYFHSCMVYQPLATPDIIPYLEHDTFLLFEKLMVYMQPLYETIQLAKVPPPPALPVSPAQLFPVAQQHDLAKVPVKSTLQQLCNTIQHRLLRRHDPQLCHHLQHEEVLPETYALRWCRLLFAREFDFDDLLPLWHLLFSTLHQETTTDGPPMMKYVAVAMLIYLDKELMPADNTECLKLLMNGTELWDVDQVIELARYLQNPMLQGMEHAEIDVVKFEKGSLGITITSQGTPYPGMLAVRSFTDPNGQGKVSGVIEIGDIIVSINGRPIHENTSDQLKTHVEQVGKPVFIAFQHGQYCDFSEESDSTKPQEPYEVSAYKPVYLTGEREFCNAEMTLHELSRSGEGVCSTAEKKGKFFISNYRCMFHQKDREGIQMQLPILSIISMDCPDMGFDHEALMKKKSMSCGNRPIFKLTIRGKDTQVVRLSTTYYQDYGKICKCLTHLSFPNDLLQAFCFKYSPYLEGGEGIEPFDIRSEYHRLGFLNSKEYKCIQQSYALCETYPMYLIVPARMSDIEISAAAVFRSRERLPVATWIHPTNGAVICRSSQPLVGFKSTRSAEDEKLVRLLCTVGNHSNAYLILDARGQLAAVGNKAMGKGTEIGAHYQGSTIMFMNIDNIHATRQSFQAIVSIFSREASFHEESTSYWTKIENSGWLKHVRSVLRASQELAKHVHDGQSVLTHCSDGWDRTAQMTALAELMLDPYYRTIRGFGVLIEKEWCSFGHQFHTRCGHARSDSNNDQRSPIFLLWLDCVWQFLRQRSAVFEFNESLLLALADHVYSCKFDNFMFDSEKVRNSHRVKHHPASIWNEIEAKKDRFLNAFYTPSTQSIILPSCHSKNIRLWEGYFCRFDITMVPGVPSLQFY